MNFCLIFQLVAIYLQVESVYTPVLKVIDCISFYIVALE